MPVPLKIQHAVHDMLHDLGTRDGAVLIDMPHHEHRRIRLLGRPHDRRGALPDLGHASRRGGDRRQIHGLDGVDDHQIRRFLPHTADDRVHIGFTQDVQIVVLHPQPVRPHFDLPLGFLSRDIEDLEGLSQIGTDLQQQGGFADARVAADEHKPAPDTAAAQHPVQLLKAGAVSLLPLGIDVPDPPHRAARRGAGGAARSLRRHADLLGPGVPLPAGRAFSIPFGRLAAARRTDKNRFRLCRHF